MMTFTISPKDLHGLLENVSKGIRKKQRKTFLVTLSVARKQISVIGNGMSASKSIPDSGQGQCKLRLAKITEILSTFPSDDPVQFECDRNGLRINNFSVTVESYKAKAVSKKEALPPAIVSSPNKKTAKKPSVSDASSEIGSYDGFSDLPLSDDNSYCAGQRGMVLPEDTQKEREPFVCPVCGSVGYFEKWIHKGNTNYRQYRTWVSAKEALSYVVLKGDERRCLCYRCASDRTTGGRKIHPLPDKQTDMFEKSESD